MIIFLLWQKMSFSLVFWEKDKVRLEFPLTLHIRKFTIKSHYASFLFGPRKSSWLSQSQHFPLLNA